MELIPAEAWTEAKSGRSDVPLICFHIVEWQFPGRVMRQFGYRQPIIRSPPRYLEDYREITLQGNYDNDWTNHFRQEIQLWNVGQRRRVKGDVIHHEFLFGISTEYREWFAIAGKPKIFPTEDYPCYWRPPPGQKGRNVSAYKRRMDAEKKWLEHPIVEYSDEQYPFQTGVDAVSDDDDGVMTEAAGLIHVGAYVPG